MHPFDALEIVNLIPGILSDVRLPVGDIFPEIVPKAEKTPPVFIPKDFCETGGLFRRPAKVIRQCLEYEIAVVRLFDMSYTGHTIRLSSAPITRDAGRKRREIYTNYTRKKTLIN